MKRAREYRIGNYVTVRGVIQYIIGIESNNDWNVEDGLGAFETADVEERIGKNPKTGQPVNIPAHRKPKFKISKTLKELVRNPISFS